MKFVFISLPMSGKTDKEIGHRLCSINGTVKAACVAKFGWKWDEIATIDNFWDHDRIEDFDSMPVKRQSVFYLGGALKKMSQADAVYFDEGWEHANGCNVERYVALKYDIPVLFYNVEYNKTDAPPTTFIQNAPLSTIKSIVEKEVKHE